MESSEISKMLINPPDYNKSNNLQYKEALKLLDKLAPKTSFPTILDIGCGSGNVTKDILNHLPKIEKIVAIDSDASMIEFAAKTNNASKIEYFHQDMSLPWDHFDERFRSFESRFDLAFSNLALHWIYPENREQAMGNIFRLLKPGGIFISNTIVPRQILDEELYLKCKHDVSQKIPEVEAEIESWTSAAQKSGFKLQFAEMTKNELEFDSKEKAAGIITVSAAFYLNHLKSGGEENVRKILEDATIKEHLRLATKDENGPVIWSYDTLKLCCVKLQD